MHYFLFRDRVGSESHILELGNCFIVMPMCQFVGEKPHAHDLRPIRGHYYPQYTDEENRERPKLRKQRKLYISSIFLPSVPCPSYECVRAAHLLFPCPASLTEGLNAGHCLPSLQSSPTPDPDP